MLNKPFELNYEQGQPYWMVDILWVVLAERATTNGQFTLLWQLCPKGSGPGLHYHDQDEGFYVIDGEITYVANGEQLVARQGSFVWIPRGTAHGFRVESETATLLNFYTPSGFEQMVFQGAALAEGFTLPPKGFDKKPDPAKMMSILNQIGMHIVHEPDPLREQQH